MNYNRAPQVSHQQFNHQGYVQNGYAPSNGHVYAQDNTNVRSINNN